MVRPLTFATYIRDEIPAPREYIELQYKGPNPMKVYGMLDSLLKRIWELKGTQMNEPDFRWDTTTDPRPFFIHMFWEKAMDKYTGYRIDLKMQGSQPTDPSKSGVLRIEIHGWIETKFDDMMGNPLGKVLFPMFYWPYHVMYYAERRRRYYEWHRRRIERFAQELREILNIPAKPIP